MKTRCLLIIILLYAFCTGTFRSKIFAQAISTLPKPITGSLIMDYELGDYDTVDGWRSYFRDMKAAGMDTAIQLAMGGFDRTNHDPTTGACTGAIQDWDYFDQNKYASAKGHIDRFLTAAKAENMKVYLGLSAAGPPCISFWDGSPSDPTSNQGHIISHSIQLLAKLRTLSESKGWGWEGNFIKGYYISQEKDVPVFAAGRDEPAYSFYKNLAGAVKSDPRFNSKPILLSPYFYTPQKLNPADPNSRNLTDQEITDLIVPAMTRATATVGIDIYVPQDSVGTTKAKTFDRDKKDFQAMSQGITAGNTNRPATWIPVQLWANIESFKTNPDCIPTESGTYPNPACNTMPYYILFPPTDFTTLRWQIRATYGNVAATVTWLHQWSMFDGYLFSTGSTVARHALRTEYLSKPIIVTAFQWPVASTPYLYVQGYNFGMLGSSARAYIHYRTGDGLSRQANAESGIFQSPTAGIYELRIPMSAFPGIYVNLPYEIAIINRDNGISYYRSQDPDTQPEPSFPEITPYPSATPTQTPTTTPTPIPANKPGDATGDGFVNGLDYVKWVTNYGRTDAAGPSQGDFSDPPDGKVDGMDYTIWLNNYGK